MFLDRSVRRRLSGDRPHHLRQAEDRHLRRRERQRVALRPAPPNASSYFFAKQLKEDLALVLRGSLAEAVVVKTCG
jgi:hypothetical protein